ncbi:hypothetical protein [Emticicia sp.]|uniref:hypothetical protein n=1 Tax=Emticicia sp. TaxID=1930953 RepID=UPI0037518C97
MFEKKYEAEKNTQKYFSIFGKNGKDILDALPPYSAPFLIGNILDFYKPFVMFSL